MQPRNSLDRCDAVIGADYSSNSVRLREVVQAAHVPAYLVDSDEKIVRAWFDQKAIIEITFGASVPEFLVNHVIEKMRTCWPDIAIGDIR